MSTRKPLPRRSFLAGAATLIAAVALGREARASGMQIFIKTLTGATISLEVHASDTVELLERTLAEKIRGYDPATTAIMYGDLTLKRGTLRDYGIPEYATLQLAPRS